MITAMCGWFHAYSGGITARAKEGLDYQKTSRRLLKACACLITSMCLRM